jgi:hypothetical protein
MKGRRHSLKVRLRAFHIWQLLGYSPWKSEWTVADDKPEGNIKGFYRGAFDSIPFLNDDAKRTFVHLLLRPGYMIRDYIKGKHDMYLAPLTSLIIFYAFFSLVSSIAHPDFEGKKEQSQVVESDSLKNRISVSLSFSDDSLYTDTDQEIAARMSQFISVADTLMFLNRYPEAINSPKRASLAAFESALRSQGINYFLGIFLLMWPAMRIALRKQSVGWAASATASAYILCQFSFFMLFVLILSLGQKNEIGPFFMGLIIMINYHQLLQTGFRKSLWLTVKTGLYMFLLILLFVLLVAIVIAEIV